MKKQKENPALQWGEDVIYVKDLIIIYVLIF